MKYDKTEYVVKRLDDPEKHGCDYCVMHPANCKEICGGDDPLSYIALVKPEDKLLEKFPINKTGGVKHDSGKVRPTLLVKSMPNALKQVLEVLEHGAQKYGADNWKLVEEHRYDDAMLRHLLLGYFSGEKTDPDSGKQHLAHLICSALFLLEKELTR